MKESRRKGIASHPDPESCVASPRPYSDCGRTAGEIPPATRSLHAQISDISAVFLHSFAPLGFINQPRINHFHTLCLETTEVGVPAKADRASQEPCDLEK
jgi:hypothetical protein